MEDRDDFDEVALKPVDQAVGPNDELAKVGTTELGDHATRLGELEEAAWCRDEPADDEPSVLLRVESDVVTNRLEVGDRPRRPDEPAHAPKRRFTSS